MNRHLKWMIALLCSTSVVLAACGDSDTPGGSSGSDVGVDSVDGTGGGGDRGSAVLTIGDETWMFDAFDCAFGHEATESAVYSFSSSSFGEHSSGARVQMLSEIRDETGQGRYTGEGVVYELTLQDIQDFENPSVDWEASNRDDPVRTALGADPGEATITLNGDTVSAEGLFDDLRTDGEFEDVAGTLDGTCSAQSRR